MYTSRWKMFCPVHQGILQGLLWYSKTASFLSCRIWANLNHFVVGSCCSLSCSSKSWRFVIATKAFIKISLWPRCCYNSTSSLKCLCVPWHVFVKLRTGTSSLFPLLHSFAVCVSTVLCANPMEHLLKKEQWVTWKYDFSGSLGYIDKDIDHCCNLLLAMFVIK